MSVLVRFRLIDKGEVIGVQEQEYERIDLAELDQYAGYEVFDRNNPEMMWIEMKVIKDADTIKTVGMG